MTGIDTLITREEAEWYLSKAMPSDHDKVRLFIEQQFIEPHMEEDDWEELKEEFRRQFGIKVMTSIAQVKEGYANKDTASVTRLHGASFGGAAGGEDAASSAPTQLYDPDAEDAESSAPTQAYDATRDPDDGPSWLAGGGVASASQPFDPQPSVVLPQDDDDDRDTGTFAEQRQPASGEHSSVIAAGFMAKHGRRIVMVLAAVACIMLVIMAFVRFWPTEQPTANTKGTASATGTSAATASVTGKKSRTKPSAQHKATSTPRPLETATAEPSSEPAPADPPPDTDDTVTATCAIGMMVTSCSLNGNDLRWEYDKSNRVWWHIVITIDATKYRSKKPFKKYGRGDAVEIVFTQQQ